MSRKYITKPKAIETNNDLDYWEPPLMSNISVFEPDEQPIATGLLDARGYELYAVEDRPIIGFLQQIRPR